MSSRAGIAMLLGVALGLCVPACKESCTAENCIGCCDSKGECHAGTQVATCGKGGAACSACEGQCVRQVCAGSSDGGRSDGGVLNTVDGGCLVGLCGAEVCDTSTGSCVTAPACDGSREQPGGCMGGRVCTAATCRDVPRPSCSNFSPSSAPLRWTPTVNFGPVLIGARAVSFAIDTTRCPAGSTRRAVVELTAYDFNGRFFPDGGYPKLLGYRENQTLTEIRDAVTTTVSPSGGNATLQVASCGSDAVTSLTVGHAFENGNGVCVTLVP